MVPVRNGRPIRIAAAGDLHSSEAARERLFSAFAALDRTVDLVLLAGDLTTCGDPDEAAVLADACRELKAPVCAVFGNHDWHLNRTHELVAVLTDAGVRVLERSSVRLDVRGQPVGVVGLKGFVGGFPDYVLPDFGEPLLRQVYAETTEDVNALDRELTTVDRGELSVERGHVLGRLGVDLAEERLPEVGQDVVGEAADEALEPDDAHVLPADVEAD